MSKYILKVIKAEEQKENELGQKIMQANDVLLGKQSFFEEELFSGEMTSDDTIEILKHAYHLKCRK